MADNINEADFTLPSFSSYVHDLDEEYQKHVESMLLDTFKTLSKAEKLLMCPLIEVHNLKQAHKTLQADSAKASLEEIARIEKQIKARLDVINENGDVHILVKKFNLLLFDLFKKKSAKSLAKMAAEALLNFIEHLKGTGELNS